MWSCTDQMTNVDKYHPGCLVRFSCLDVFDLSVIEAARHLGAIRKAQTVVPLNSHANSLTAEVTL
jgi:hypothetical protein